MHFIARTSLETHQLRYSLSVSVRIARCSRGGVAQQTIVRVPNVYSRGPRQPRQSALIAFALYTVCSAGSSAAMRQCTSSETRRRKGDTSYVSGSRRVQCVCVCVYICTQITVTVVCDCEYDIVCFFVRSLK